MLREAQVTRRRAPGGLTVVGAAGAGISLGTTALFGDSDRSGNNVAAGERGHVEYVLRIDDNPGPGGTGNGTRPERAASAIDFYSEQGRHTKP